jgi:DNA-binding GntR family transcriptional regulator
MPERRVPILVPFVGSRDIHHGLLVYGCRRPGAGTASLEGPLNTKAHPGRSRPTRSRCPQPRRGIPDAMLGRAAYSDTRPTRPRSASGNRVADGMPSGMIMCPNGRPYGMPSASPATTNGRPAAVERGVNGEPNATRRIFQDLAERITRWELQSGARLTERELSQEYAVSRTPVREALRLLEQAGLVTPTPPRGYVVRAFDLAMIDQVYVVRTALETLAVSLAAGAVHTEAFQELKRLTQASAGSDSLREEFHERLAELSGNAELARILREIDVRIQGCRRLDAALPDRIESAHQEHIEVLRLLEDGRVQEAQDLMGEHIERSHSVVRTLLNAGVTSLSFGQRSMGS